MAIKKVYVVGAGLMGAGIAQVAATAGYQVTMRDINDEALDKGMKTIEKSPVSYTHLTLPTNREV